MSPAKPNPKTSSNVTSEALQRATGKTWPEWIALLDQAHASALPHPEIVQLLRKKHTVETWYSQIITVGYEQARGLRTAHQKPGGFDVSASRTMECPVAEAYACFVVPAKRRGWSPSQNFTIRRTQHSRALRITWSDETDVNVMFHERGPTRCTVTVEHSKLATESESQMMQQQWRDALEALAGKLEGADYSKAKIAHERELRAQGPGARGNNTRGKPARGKTARGKPAPRKRDS